MGMYDVADEIAKAIISIANEAIREQYNSTGEGTSQFHTATEGNIRIRGVEPPRPNKYGRAMVVLPFSILADESGQICIATNMALYYNNIKGLKKLMTKWNRYCYQHSPIERCGVIAEGELYVTAKGDSRIAKVRLRYM